MAAHPIQFLRRALRFGIGIWMLLCLMNWDLLCITRLSALHSILGAIALARAHGGEGNFGACELHRTSLVLRIASFLVKAMQLRNSGITSIVIKSGNRSI
jgi:hypothetical protein